MLDPSGSYESHYTLGTFYGWFGSSLFGALAGLLIIAAYTKGSGKRRIASMLIGMVLCGACVCAGDAASDWIGIRMDYAGTPHTLIVPLLWAIFQAAGLCTAIIATTGFRKELVNRWLVAILICAISAFVLREVVDVAVSMALVPVLMSKMSGTFNMWELAAPGFLAANLAIGLSAGVALAFAERITRSAWLTLPVGRGEGYSWTLDQQVTGVGSQEGLAVRLSPSAYLAPFHAAIQRHSDQFAFHDTGSGFPTLLNGYQIQSAWLAHGDQIQVGEYVLVFHLKRPGARPFDAPPAMSASSELPRQPISHPAQSAQVATTAAIPRLVDDFGREYPLGPNSTVVGRETTCDIALTWEATASRRHAQISRAPSGFLIEDLGSSNGTRLNGVPVMAPTPLIKGDVVEIGRAKLTFRA
jgi:pSer/pThr/pTyr-binding forkhead associated (FHA) protein